MERIKVSELSNSNIDPKDIIGRDLLADIDTPTLRYPENTKESGYALFRAENFIGNILGHRENQKTGYKYLLVTNPLRGKNEDAPEAIFVPMHKTKIVEETPDEPPSAPKKEASNNEDDQNKKPKTPKAPKAPPQPASKSLLDENVAGIRVLDALEMITIIVLIFSISIFVNKNF